MEVINYISKKNSIREYISLSFSTFTSKEKFTSRKKINTIPKFKISETIVGKNRTESEEIEKFLSDNITKLVIFPLFSTKTIVSSNQINVNTVSGDFLEPFTKPGDYLLYGDNIKNLSFVEIIEVNSNVITLSTNIDLYEKQIIATGKIMTLDKKIKINKTSNVYWEFDIMGSEL